MDPSKYSFPDVRNIVREKEQIGQGPTRLLRPKVADIKNPSVDFENDPGVPPLI